MPLLIAGSIATDHLMTFEGKFEDSLVVEQLDKLSVSFLVNDLEIRRGGVAPNGGVCDPAVDKEAKVPYEADYFFWK